MRGKMKNIIQERICGCHQFNPELCEGRINFINPRVIFKGEAGNVKHYILKMLLFYLCIYLFIVYLERSQNHMNV